MRSMLPRDEGRLPADALHDVITLIRDHRDARAVPICLLVALEPLNAKMKINFSTIRECRHFVKLSHESYAHF